jgi:hypothetical protein
MYYRYIPQPFPPQTRVPARVATASPEGPRTRAVVALGMLCVPLISFGFVLGLYIFLTA